MVYFVEYQIFFGAKIFVFLEISVLLLYVDLNIRIFLSRNESFIL